MSTAPIAASTATAPPQIQRMYTSMPMADDATSPLPAASPPASPPVAAWGAAAGGGGGGGGAPPLTRTVTMDVDDLPFQKKLTKEGFPEKWLGPIGAPSAIPEWYEDDHPKRIMRLKYEAAIAAATAAPPTTVEIPPSSPQPEKESK